MIVHEPCRHCIEFSVAERIRRRIGLGLIPDRSRANQFNTKISVALAESLDSGRRQSAGIWQRCHWCSILEPA